MARTSDKAAYRAEIIRRYRRSGLTQPRYCRENDISYHSLRWWLHQPRAKRAMGALHDEAVRKTRPEPPPAARRQAARLLPFRVVETAADRDPDRPPPVSPPPIQVLLGRGRRIAVGPGFDPDVLRRVVVATEAPRC
jgi:transposase-like protein